MLVDQQIENSMATPISAQRKSTSTAAIGGSLARVTVLDIVISSASLANPFAVS